MMEINKKSNQNNNRTKRKKNKIKRQISIFTIILWIFLISTMITITVNSTKKTNALEVEDENWNIQLVMYDRSSDTPNEAITEFTWNAEKSNETKQLCMQINYACTTNKGYQPGEIEITIPGIEKDSFSEYWRNVVYKNSTEFNKWLGSSVTIAADKKNDTTKKYDWSYSYNESKNMYTFINNGVVEENEHFEGTIQIIYILKPYFKIQTGLQFQASVKENIQNVEEIIAKKSNTCSFYYTSTKKNLKLEKIATSAPKVDYTKIEDILNDYYWVRYYFSFDIDSNIINIFDVSDGKIDKSGNFKCIKENLPDGCVLYDKDLNKIDPSENNTYYYLRVSNPISYYYYYVGYPKDRYNEGNSITNTAEIWGRYEDESEMQKITESSSNVNLVEFDFEYKGILYQIEKDFRYNGTEFYLNRIKNGGNGNWWSLKANVFYTGKLMDVEIGDDLLYITRENGEVTKLSDGEYNFSKILIPIFKTYNKYSQNEGEILIGYNYELQVRYKNTSEYIVYKEGITSDKSEEVEFDRDDIVGIRVVIKNLDKTLYMSKNAIFVYTIIHTQDCKSGFDAIYNFDYLQVYEKDEIGNRILINESTLENYNTQSTKLNVAEYDLSTYGTYMQRSYKACKINNGVFILRNKKASKLVFNDVQNKKYDIEYNLETSFRIECFDVNQGCIIKQYDILPSGMNLKSTKEEIVNSIVINLSYSNLKLKDGTRFNTKEELENYIKEKTIIEIDYNYRDSGRTKINIIYNLNEIDWSYYLSSKFNNNISLCLNTEIPYDSILEYGESYKNIVYNMWNNQEYGYSNQESVKDNGWFGSLTSDIDNDGDTEEKVAYSSNVLNITHAVSSQQAVIKQVRTDLTKGKFVEETAETTAGSEYTYKLRVTTGANSLKDLIIYDTLETIYDEEETDISNGWTGKFLGVDTEYAVSKGYAPKVYYSEEKNPGKLTEVPEKWMELTDDVDKNIVKSICVDLRYKADGTEMKLSANNVVFVLINMQAPEDESLLTSANNMFSTNWRAIDPLGEVIDNVEGIYSNQVNVEIHKDDIRTEISGIKIWEDDDNKFGIRPESITVKLLQDGQEYETKTVTADNNWNYTFENIPVYESNTREYEYEIVEESIDNYITEYDGYNITNKVNKTEIKVEKIWVDNENEAKKRPESVKVNLLKNSKVIDSILLNSENEWKHTFANLEKYDENLDEIIYTIDEEIDSKFYIKNIVENVITNRFVVPEDRIKLVGRKVWNDNNNMAEKRPKSVVLQVKVGNEIVTEQAVNEESNWSYEFELAKYDKFGNEIEYTIDEKESTSKFYIKEKVEKISDTEFIVTNKFEVPDEKKEIWVRKTWIDEENKYGKRPTSIILQIKNKEEIVEEVEINESDEWKYKFELEKYDKLGDEIEYTVDEKETSKYYEKTIEGFVIINKCIYEPAVDTSDMNVITYVIIFLVAIIGVIVGTNFIRNKNLIKN